MADKILLTLELPEDFLASVASFLSKITVAAEKETEKEKEERTKEEEKEKDKEKDITTSALALLGNSDKPVGSGDKPVGNSDKLVGLSKEYEEPTYEALSDYIRTKQYVINPKVIFDRYSGNGWTTASGEKIKHWEWTIDAWERRERQKNPNAKPFFKVWKFSGNDDLENLERTVKNDKAECNSSN